MRIKVSIGVNKEQINITHPIAYTSGTILPRFEGMYQRNDNT